MNRMLHRLAAVAVLVSSSEMPRWPRPACRTKNSTNSDSNRSLPNSRPGRPARTPT